MTREQQHRELVQNVSRVRTVLKNCGGNQAEAARRLGMSRTRVKQILGRAKELGI